MKKRENEILQWINARKERNEITTCIFDITVPKNVDLDKDETIRKVKKILNKNHVKHGRVDTLSGAWNLNRDWIETNEIDCIVEYCGVYPINWDIADVVELERMEDNGEIIMFVEWVVDGKCIPNH